MVYKTLSQYNKHERHFCSNKCQALARREDSFEYRECPICHSLFYVSKKSSKHFCSCSCQNEWQKENSGFKNPKFQGKFLECESCGKGFLAGKYKVHEHKHHFCSVECRRAWYANVWSQAPEWKKESRKRAVDILSKNKAATQTKPQIAMNNLLDEMGIPYRNEEPFTYYSIDNYLPDYGIAIEVMGDYWHSSPSKYSRDINDVQKRVLRRDKAKHTYMKEHQKIEILYIWETDILKRKELCAKLVSLYISNGHLENYHSFNYSVNEHDEIELNSEIVHPLWDDSKNKDIAC